MTHAAHAADQEGGFRLRKIISLMSQLIPSVVSGEGAPVAAGPQSAQHPAVAEPPRPDPLRGQGAPSGEAVGGERSPSAELETARRAFRDLVCRLGRAGDELADLMTAQGGTVAPPAGSELSALAAELSSRLRRLDERLDRVEQGVAARFDLPPAVLDPVLGACLQVTQVVKLGFEQQQASLACAQAATQAGLERVIELATPPAPVNPGAPSVHEWQSALFGDALASDIELATLITEVCQNLLAGDAAASTFVGQLLIYRHSAPERRPQLLKDIGEAYYRCFPKVDDADGLFERALVTWLQRTCEQAGFQNRIEPVHPGERFDSTRHTTLDKGGVEIVRVHGWVVLRDPGKVYTKALVSVR